MYRRSNSRRYYISLLLDSSHWTLTWQFFRLEEQACDLAKHRAIYMQTRRISLQLRCHICLQVHSVLHQKYKCQALRYPVRYLGGQFSPPLDPATTISRRYRCSEDRDRTYLNKDIICLTRRIIRCRDLDHWNLCAHPSHLLQGSQTLGAVAPVVEALGEDLH